MAPEWLRVRMDVMAAGSVEPGSDRAWPVEQRNGHFYRYAPRSTFVSSHYEFRHSVGIDGLGGRMVEGGDSGRGPFVPFLGDSFTFGVGVSDQETYVSLLQRDVDLRLLNLGVPGTALPQQLDLLELRHQELGHPSLYIFTFYVGNDYTDLVFRRERLDATGAERFDGSHVLGFVNDVVHRQAWLRHSFLVQLMKQRTQSIANHWKPTLMEPIFQAARLDGDHLDRAQRYLSSELDRLGEMSMRLRFRYAFLIVPDRHQLDRTQAARKLEYYGLDPLKVDMMRPTRAIVSALNERSVSFLELSACLREQPGRLYYVQDHHFTPAGHRVAAACARSWVHEQLASKAGV